MNPYPSLRKGINYVLAPRASHIAKPKYEAIQRDISTVSIGKKSGE